MECESKSDDDKREYTHGIILNKDRQVGHHQYQHHLRTSFSLINKKGETCLDLITAYGQQFFYFKSPKELTKQLRTACKKLGIDGDDDLQRLNELLKEKQSEKTMFAGNEANPIHPKRGRIKGESLRFIIELLGEPIQDLEGKINRITGVNGQGGILEPRFPDENHLLVVLTRLYSAMASDGHIRNESGKGEYYDPKISRIERVIENLNELGQIKSRIIEKTRGIYRLHIPSVVGSLLILMGFPIGDRTMQNKGLPPLIVKGPPEVLIAYLEEMVPEEGCFNNTTGISWNRTHGVYGTGKAGKKYQQPSLSKKQVDYIKKIASDTGDSKDRKTLPWSELVLKAEDGNEIAKGIVDFVNSHPNQLIKDEARVAGRLGIEVDEGPYRLRYYKKTGRITLVSSARTKSIDDAERWGQICPPNDVEKRKKMIEWLSRRKAGAVSSAD
jgi:hypothetical protein